MSFSQLNILLADDDTDDCMFFKDALNEIEPSSMFNSVHDGEELMKHLSENSDNLPTVIFLDLNMPRKNGVECLTEIKQNNQFKEIAVVMFSTFYSPDTISMLFKIGANVYIRKTGDLTQLKQVINHAIAMAIEKVAPTSQVKYILNA